jgi:hypothetical protein
MTKNRLSSVTKWPWLRLEYMDERASLRIGRRFTGGKSCSKDGTLASRQEESPNKPQTANQESADSFS